RLLERSRLEERSEIDRVRLGIRHLDADRAFPGDRCDDADARCAQCEREVGIERGDPVHLHARRLYDLELRDDRPRRATRDLTLDLERAQRLDQYLAQSVELA